MKIVTMIARILLGLVFLVFGLNKFFNFIPSGPMPAGAAGQFMEALLSTHYLMAVGVFETVGGLLLLINRYVPLGLCLLAPVIVNILLVGTLMTHMALPSGIVVTILWILSDLNVSVQAIAAPATSAAKRKSARCPTVSRVTATAHRRKGH